MAVPGRIVILLLCLVKVSRCYSSSGSTVTVDGIPGVTLATVDNDTTVTLSTPHKKLLRNETSVITITVNTTSNTDIIFNVTSSQPDIINLPGGSKVVLKAGENTTNVSIAAGNHVGTVYFTTNLISPNISLSIPDLNMAVVHSKTLALVNVVLGWLCFTAWSVSFYPQVYKNWKRKSVIGLSFDFLGYNMLGWICYSMFNMALLWYPDVRREYYDKYPHGVINVQISDFCFSFHAFLITGVTILQCLVYERGGQTPSALCRTLLAIFVCAMVIMLIVAVSGCITWLQYVSIFSYVKLAVTLFKYSPQVYVNFKKKSTEAVSIYQFLLDLTGGAISLLQMSLIAYNYDDWKTFLGDFTKFGLATLSILYDLIFIVQHYVLYRHSPRSQALNRDVNTAEDSEPLIS